MDTIEAMVVPAPEPSAPPQPQFNRLWWAAPVLLFVLAVGALLNTALPYYAIGPGDAREVNDLIAAPDGSVHPPRGRIYLATVSLRRVKPLDALQGWLDEDTEVVHEDQILGTTPPDRYREQNLRLMDDSKQTAMVVALRHVGYQVAEHGKGALVVGVVDGMPADGRLAEGDVIVSVDGTPTTLVDQAVARIRAHRPGESVRLEVTGAKGDTRVEQLTLAEREGQAVLGVTMRTKDRTFDLPIDVEIESGRIGGPSAGLAFALGLIDELSPGELTGGRRVAVTGTIEIDGTVGDVGGVAQKTAAVRREGVRFFIVPPGEYEVARRYAGSKLTVLKAGTLDEALAALTRIGGEVP